MQAKRPSKEPEVVDHRTRVGRERRARTQSRIIEAALHVFAGKGPDAPVIEDFIKTAGVARGTFYNYYKSTDELLEATSKWLEDDLIMSIEAAMEELNDPVERLTTGVLLWMKKAESDPAWCAFVVRVRHHGRLVERQLAGDLRAGLRAGDFSFPSLPVARDLVIGTMREAMSRMTQERVPKTHAEDVARVVLQGLGLDSRMVERALSRPLPKIRRLARSIE